MPIKFIKNQTFIIESVENNMAVLKGQDKNNEYNEIVNEGKPLDLKKFEPFFACTVFKLQGTTILINYNIIDLQRMNLNEVYVAISRAKRLDQIHLNISRENISTEYNDSKIYKITSPNINECYIGSTIQSLDDRLKEHLEDFKNFKNKTSDAYVSSFKILEAGKPKIELLQNVNVNSLQELLKIEGEWVTTTHNAVNIRTPGRTFNKYDNNGNKIFESYKEQISDDNIFEKSLTRYYYVEYDEENKKANIIIKTDKNDEHKLEYVSLYKDCYENNKKEQPKKENDKKYEEKDIVVNDLKLMLQSKGYEVSLNKKKLKVPIDKNYTGIYQDKVKEFIKITENGNRFKIKCKLPNGENFEIKKRFKPSINKDDVKNEMIFIRDKLIQEHYILGVKETKVIQPVETPAKGKEPAPKQVEKPEKTTPSKRTLKF
ncbi:MAG: hypothetical protein ACXVHY_08515 [Methanobacterium sp.]